MKALHDWWCPASKHGKIKYIDRIYRMLQRKELNRVWWIATYKYRFEKKVITLKNGQISEARSNGGLDLLRCGLETKNGNVRVPGSSVHCACAGRQHHRCMIAKWTWNIRYAGRCGRTWRIYRLGDFDAWRNTVPYVNKGPVRWKLKIEQIK